MQEQAPAGPRSRIARTGGPGTDPGFPALKAQVIGRTGHHYYADKDDLLYDRLVRRFRAHGLLACEAYAVLLAGPEGPEEWAALEAEITIGETFFFRYAEQFAALRDTILPDLIAARRRERSLRIWSAGCASGAEPYSIAILVHELLGEALPDWDVTILGTDISTAALAAAEAAEFGRWALRTLPAEQSARWFRRTPPRPGVTRDGGYMLRPEYRRLVRFERQNLLGLIDGTLPARYTGFDLVLCRNVLIYFSAEHVAGMVRGFGSRLRQDGWLLLGHAEPNPLFSAWLDPVNLPGTVAYRRQGEPALPAPVPSATSPLVPFAEPPLAPAPSPAIPLSLPPEPAADGPGATDGSSVARIRTLADTGETGEAWRVLRDALGAAPTDPVLRFYEGLLALSLGRDEEAERALRGALFLDRDFVMAHYHLGLLMIARGRPEPARRALGNALRLARAMSSDTLLAEGDGVTAGALAEHAQRALRER